MAESLPPDVVFAQKATAIVKAAGMDPKSMDLESFRKWAPIIFTRAYCAIYKEKLISELSEFSSKEEQILNSQLVIDGMLAKTRNATLASITGIDIFQGNHKAIGILVGVLFAEGQRMWTEKAKARRLAQEQAEQQLLSSDRPMTPLRTTDLDGHPETQSPLNSPSGAAANTELDKLLHRINYLETKLRRKGTRKSKSWREGNSPGRISPHSKGRPRPASASATRPREDPHSDLSDSHGVDDEGLLVDRDEHEEEGQVREHLRPVSQQGRRRPASSPGLRRSKVSDRLYSAPLNRRAMEDLVASNAPPPAPKERFDSSLYTYDMKSGRRILISQAEADKEEIRRKKAAMGNIMIITDYEDEMMAGKKAAAPPASPGRSEYPGKRIEKSVEEWLSKMRRDRVSGEQKRKFRNSSPRRGDADSGIYHQAQREFAMYGSLERLDVLLTVEHCHSCESHRISTRHNAAEYVKLADSMLVHLAQEVLSDGLCVRLGVARLEAHFDHFQETEVGMRYGAFEVQVACRTPSGRLEIDVLHSKLLSRRWPSKTVLAKRLKAFLSKHRLPMSSMLAGEEFTLVNEDGQNYPLGKCTWSDTPLSEMGWCFASFQASRSKSPVQYVFDWRTIHDTPLFANGSQVWIRHALFDGHTEPHPCLATVLYYSPDAANGEKMIFVQFKYASSSDGEREVLVKEKQCLPLNEYKGGNFHASDVPGVAMELQGALQLANAEKLLHFKAADPEDRVNSKGVIEVSRASFFRQLRTMVWQTVQRFRERHIHALVHPSLATPFDAHLAYSEAALDALVDRFGSPLNVSQLLDVLGLKGPKAPQGSSSTVESRQSSSSGGAAGQGRGEAAREEEVRPPARTVTTESVSSGPSPTATTTSAKPLPSTPSSTASSSSTVKALAGIVKPQPPGMSAHGPVTAQVLETIGEALLTSFPSRPRLEGFCQELYPGYSSHADSSSSAEKELVATLLDVVDKLSDYGCDVLTHSNTAMNAVATTFQPKDAGGGSAGSIRVKAFLDWLQSGWQRLHAPEETVSNVPATHAQHGELIAGLAEAIVSSLSESGLTSLCAELHGLAKAKEGGGLEMDTVRAKLAEHGCDVLAESTAASQALAARFQLDDKKDLVNVSDVCVWLQESYRASHPEAPARKDQAASSGEATIEPAAGAAPSSPPAKLVPQRTASDSLQFDVEAVSAATVSVTAPTSAAGEPQAPSVPPPPSSASPRASEARAEVVAPAAETETSTALPTQISGLLLTESDAALGKDTTEDEYNESFLHASQLDEAETQPLPPSTPLPASSAPPQLQALPSGGAMEEPLSARSAEETATGDQVGQLLMSMDVVISAIIVEGAVLTHGGYDSISAILEINGHRHQTSTCLPREKQSKRRTFNVDWGEILITVHQFQTSMATLLLVCTEDDVSSSFPRAPVLSSGSAAGCPQVPIPLHQFSTSSFEHKVEISLPDLATESGKATVVVTIQGHAHEAREARTTRILSMKPTDLVNLKFDPIPGVDDYNSDDQESVDDENTGRRGGGGLGGIGGVGGIASKSSQDLHNALFPAPSLLDVKSLL